MNVEVFVEKGACPYCGSDEVIISKPLKQKKKPYLNFCDFEYKCKFFCAHCCNKHSISFLGNIINDKPVPIVSSLNTSLDLRQQLGLSENDITNNALKSKIYFVDKDSQLMYEIGEFIGYTHKKKFDKCIDNLLKK